MEVDPSDDRTATLSSQTASTLSSTQQQHPPATRANPDPDPDPDPDSEEEDEGDNDPHRNNNDDDEEDRAALARHGLLCDEDTEAVLAEVAGTLHHQQGGGGGAAGGEHQQPEHNTKKRKAEDDLLPKAGGRHLREGGGGDGGRGANEFHDGSNDENHDASSSYDHHEVDPLGPHDDHDEDDHDDDDVFDDHHEDDEDGSHHSLLNASGGGAGASASADSGEAAASSEAIVAAAAVAAAAALTASSSGSTSTSRQRLTGVMARKSVPPRVSWEDRVDQLRAYKDEHGDLLIPIRYKSNPSLGKFVHNTREQFKLFHKRAPANYKKKCSLTQERIAQLDEIGFVWATERSKKQDEDWNARLVQLREYKEAHGDCLVPHGYKLDPSFAEWVHRQRTTYAIHLKEGRVNPMVEGRMKKLEEMGFNFRVHVDKWTEHYEQLQEYRKQNGNCLVPTHFSSNMKLGRWVHTQRHQYRLMQRGRKSSMTNERAKLLEELGFNWEVRPGVDRPTVSWHQRYLELEKFVKTNGHFNISPVENAPLYAWCSEQLQRLKAIAEHPPGAVGSSETKVKGMGHDRIKLLANIGFTKDIQLTPVECEAGAAAVAAEAAARELDGHSSHEEDEVGDNDHQMDHDIDDEESHQGEGVDGFDESAKAEEAGAAVTVIHDENQGVSVEV